MEINELLKYHKLFEQKKEEVFGQLYKQWANKYPKVKSVYWEYQSHWNLPFILIKDGVYVIAWQEEIENQFYKFVQELGLEILATFPSKNLIVLDDYR